MLESLMGMRLRGVTLPELLTAMSVVAILLAFGLPSLATMFAKVRLQGASAEFGTDLHYARSEALRQRRAVTVSTNDGGDGYDIVVDGVAVKTVSLPLGVTVTSSTAVSYDSMRALAAPAEQAFQFATQTGAALRAVRLDAWIFHMLTRRDRRVPPKRQRGFTLVELMVGTAIGLFVVAGTVSLYATNVGASRRLLVEARLNQDLRASMDLVSRDLRRAGYWGNAITGTSITGAAAAAPANPYRGIDASVTDQVTYQFSRDQVEDEVVAETERFGFRLQDGVLQMQTQQDNWEPMTDSDVVKVLEFSIETTETEMPLGSLCTTVCAVGTPNCPTVTVRRFAVRLRGESATDASIQRTLQTSVRPRNDQLEGQCPA